MSSKYLYCLSALSFLFAVAAHAQISVNWNGGGGNNKWSTAANWVGSNTPDNNGEKAAFVGGAGVLIEVDQDFTINAYTDGFAGAGFTHSLYGGGVLTIDRNSAGTSTGLTNATGNAGSTFRMNGKVTINNSGGGTTSVTNNNSSGNTVLFDTGSVLTLTTPLQTIQGSGGSIQFNGTLAASGANLIMNSTTASFGVGHLSTNFGRDIVFNGNSKLAVNGGTVLNTGRKFQVNGNGAELELNGVGAINGANIVVGGSNNFLLDVNADQTNMGSINIGDGVLTIDLDTSVTALAFMDSSAEAWGTGTVSISGFEENLIRFGTDASGLTLDQLAAINAGAYNLSASGYLTAVPEPASIGFLAGFFVIALVGIRRRNRE